jgi:hypothetical protein
MKIVGILLIIIGLGLTIFTTTTFFTKEKVVDIGKIEITRDKPHILNWTPLIGVAVVVIGGIVLWRAYKK